MPSTAEEDDLDLVVIGAGPAGRALAHRATTAGLAVALVDPQPDKCWSQTFGVFVDDLPGWLSTDCLATRSETVTVYTPARRVIARPYAVLDNAALQEVLALPGVRIVTGRATEMSPHHVTVDGGRTVRARVVVDATGGANAAAEAPRQRAYGVIGVIGVAGEPETVLMDWRLPTPGTPGPPTFSYQIPLPDGRFLVEETYLAGRPPEMTELRRRWAERGTPTGWVRDEELSGGDIEQVDFPLIGPTPWRADGSPLRFGAAGGLMHPATGYSVAASLSSVDVVVQAIAAGRDPQAALWPWRARAVYRLRERGMHLLASLDTEQIQHFFDAFFQVAPTAQRAYLGSRDDLAGLLVAMWSTFGHSDRRRRRLIARHAIWGPVEQIRARRR